MAYKIPNHAISVTPSTFCLFKQIYDHIITNMLHRCGRIKSTALYTLKSEITCFFLIFCQYDEKLELGILKN